MERSDSRFSNVKIGLNDLQCYRFPRPKTAVCRNCSNSLKIQRRLQSAPACGKRCRESPITKISPSSREKIQSRENDSGKANEIGSICNSC